MGKIQDAIKKVQRDRQKSIPSSVDDASAPTGELGSVAQDRGVASHAEQSVTERIWDYGGRKISIDRQKLIDAGLLDPDYLRKHLSNEYRQIRKALMANIMNDSDAGAGRRNLITIASAEHGEGRSFLSLNLAISLAPEPGYTVVLVDSDSDNPQLSELLGLAGETGFAELLADPLLDALQLISPTDIPGLSVLPAGKHHDDLAKSFESGQATTFFDGLSAADPKRIFICDSAPINSSSEALAIAGQMGQVLFVVQSGKTPQQSVREALGKLDRARPISIVLNQVID
jgi:protein-tyrosine kinase